MLNMMPLNRSMMNPFAEMDQMARDFFGGSSLRAFSTDIKDTGDSYVLEAELPGFNKEDIQIDIDGDRLTIQASHSSESEENKEGEEKEQSSYLRRERYYGSYSRSFDISQIDADKIAASYENGVLSLNLPKRVEVTPASRHLEIQ